MAVVLFDEPGPRGRRRILVGSVLAVVLVLVPLVGFVVWRLEQTGQFRAAYWEPFGGAGVQRILLRGLGATLRAAGLALVLALVLGVVLGVAQRAHVRPVRWLATGFVGLFRAIPLVLLIFFAFLGIPRITGNALEPFTALVVGLTLYNGSVFAEIFRAGIRAVPAGQVEAALSIGLTRGAVTRLVQLPQAVRTMLPTLVSQMVVLLKDSALGFIVAYPELLRSGRRIYTNVGNVIPTAMVIAAIYIVINLALTGIATWLERRLRTGRRSRARTGLDAPPVAADGGLSQI
ncbi:MAG TPA: amino acid ABC transporter permease [Iamia sp.]|nr:amino acid ABC transporter permease [Iamia sp.]